MDEMEVLEALGHLVAVTPGWEDPATIDEYVRHLIDLDSPVALKAACISIARGWDQLVRPSPKIILDSYDREVVFTTKAIEPSRVHCDGSGNIVVVDDEGYRWARPCPRCCPARAAIMSDRDKAEQYRQGTPMEHLTTDVERVTGRLRYRGGFRPPRCLPAFDEPEDMPTIKAGLDIAFKAWLEDHPKGKRREFDKLIGRSGLEAPRARKVGA